jgi:hypothetical protein
MSDVQIEKGIPVPTRGRASKYPWNELQVGDSFLLPNDDAPSASSLSTGAKKAGIKIKVREVENGVRVWRTE